MKYIICLLSSIAAYQTHAIPSAHSLSPSNVTSLIPVPGYGASIDLAARIEFSNDCVASNSIVSSYQKDFVSVTVYNAQNSNEVACPMSYEPVGKWAVVAKDVKVGTVVTVNNMTLNVSEPQPAICTLEMCPIGQKDVFTCACESDFINN